MGATAATFLLGMKLTNRTRVDYVYVYESADYVYEIVVLIMFMWN